MDATKMSDSGDAIELSQSRYIMAKYRIQLIDPQNEGVISAVFDDELLEHKRSQHLHQDPEALEYNPDGGKFGCNKSTFMQMLGCCCLPVYEFCNCCAHCFDRLFDCLSVFGTRLEEKHTLNWCCCCKCCRIKYR